MLTSCGLVREALSAQLDGEAAPLGAAEVEAHLAGCPSCRAFDVGAPAITRRVRLHALRPIPDLTAELVAALPGPGARIVGGRRGGRWQIRRPAQWGLVAQWAAAVVPLGVAVPALALGAFTHVHVVPSHVPTPCTFMLLLHHARVVR